DQLHLLCNKILKVSTETYRIGRPEELFPSLPVSGQLQRRTKDGERAADNPAGAETDSGRSRWVIFLEILFGAALTLSAVYIAWKKMRQRLDRRLRQEIIDHKQTAQTLRESEERYSSLVENATIGIVQIDADYNILMLNPALSRMFDKTFDELVGKKCFQEFEKRDTVCEYCPCTQSMVSGQPEESEIRSSRGDRNWFYARCKAVPIFDENGKVKGFTKFVEDITDFKRNEQSLRESEAESRKLVRELATSLSEKEVLLREIHHRVKNNLQIVISLLRSQSRQLTDKKMIEVFRESRNRIKAMSLIHETLFQSSDLSYVDFNSYVNKLAMTLFQAFGIEQHRIRLIIKAEEISLDIDDAIPAGLVVNELLTNSLKYAFPDAGPGEIRITMKSLNEDRIELTVSDNGVGLPDNLDFCDIETLGLTLVSGLVEVQLDGSLDMNRTGGTRFTIRFRQEKRKG
ncbi:histidine kinase dimerization/phosphoacceptor domain -containing protein, partial [Desulfobacterales bacterium HSG2]|nr:histidine kinase dimerization/phosphoacceptor domain -containing protein [Desulfobacterales bacterium HSG2]